MQIQPPPGLKPWGVAGAPKAGWVQETPGEGTQGGGAHEKRKRGQPWGAGGLVHTR